MMTLAFAAATMMSACSEEGNPKQSQGKEDVTGAKFALSGSGDTAAIEFNIQRVTCDGEPITPWSQIESVPISGSGDVLTDYFVLLAPGCYDVTAQPLTSSGTPSLDCSAGYIDQLVIIDGTTTEKGITIQCEGGSVGAADLWVVLNTPPIISNVTFDPNKFVSHCGVQTICVEFTDPDGNPVDIEWHQRSGTLLAAGPTPGTIQYDPATKKTSQCATLEHAGPGTVGLEVIAFDKQAVPGGGLIRVEDYYASMGLSIESRDSLKFPSHGTIGENCPCAPNPELCDNFDNDCDGQNNEGLSCACLPFDTQYCYTGPAGTAGVGECRSGGQPCELDGSGWDTTCYGQVLPQAEQCNNKDDDCDGQTDEGLAGCNPVCVVPSSQACVYTGPAGTENVGACQAGAQICLAGGQWSACTGEVVPVAEILANGIDDNCNGQVDEGGCDPTGTPLGESCNGVAIVGTYADGNCGTYTQQVEACSTQCGAPVAGTSLGEACGWPGTYDLYGTYADGACGTYNQVIQYNAQQCICANPTPANTLLSQSCSGYALVGSYADGSCGSYTQTIVSCTAQCGAPTYGTQIGQPWCTGADQYGSFADGNCGSYTQVIQYGSPQCCAASGTQIGNSFCSGPDLYANYANGSCGSYTQVVQYSSPQCAVCGDGVCNGNESSGTCPTDCPPPVTCVDGCFESDASGNYQASGPYDALKVCRPSGGFDFYLCSDALGCSDYPAGCFYGGWHP